MIIKTTAKFNRNYKKLPQEIKEKAKKKEIIFRNNPFDPRLKTHKLHGDDKNYWSFSIDYNNRIKFYFSKNNEFLFIDIGTHKIYK